MSLEVKIQQYNECLLIVSFSYTKGLVVNFSMLENQQVQINEW